MSEEMKVTVINHPLVQHKLTLMRQKETGTKDFRELLEEIAMLMTYEITRDFPLKEVEIETPVAKCRSKVLAGKKVGVVPILRAGLGMLSGVLNMVPAARVGHIGLYRDPETLKPVEYYCKLPSDVEERTLIVVDPMLATGGSASAALQMIKDRETSTQNNGFWLNQIYSSYFYNESRDSNITDYEAVINSITAKDIQAMAKKYLDLTHYAVGTLKPVQQ